MKLICINNKIGKHDDINFNLTIGKEYECTNETEFYYVVKINNNCEGLFEKYYFITMEEYRNQKLRELGI
jgi:hypothetical protein